VTDRLPGLKFLAFTLLCVVAAAWLVAVTGNLHRIPLLSPANVHEAVLDDVAGLVEGDDVRLAGVPVGRVLDLSVERGNAVVTFELDPDVPITDTWDVSARWRNVIGQRYLYLYPVDGGERLADGDRIPLERSRRTADIGRFFNEITPLLRAIDPEQQNKLLDALNTALVGKETRVQDLVRDLGSLGATVADQEAEIRTVLREGSSLLAEYNRREEELSGLLTDLAAVGSTLRARNDELLAAVTDIGTVQAELGDMIERNHDEIHGVVDNVEGITDAIGEQRDEFALSLQNARDGFGTYMLISRWGQWFNVRIVAAQAMQGEQVVMCVTEGNTPCNAANDAGAQARGEQRSFERPATPHSPEEDPGSRENPPSSESGGSASDGASAHQPGTPAQDVGSSQRRPVLEAVTGNALRAEGGTR
jgi:phospholipid/cholesterol/gamma-HCH transport system substrate-binding protein